MPDSPLAAVIAGFEGKRVLVVGDMVADQYIVGRPSRISREAPVLILEHREEFIRPGGAANVALNLAALGADTLVAGVIGDDSPGRSLSSELSKLGIDHDSVIIDPSRPTATKTRVIGGGSQEKQQQIVRIDRADRSDLSQAIQTTLTESILGHLPNVDGIILSDYENGVMAAGVINAVLPAAQSLGLLIAVDSHGDLFRFHGATVATPNQPEVEQTLARRLNTLEDLETGGEELRAGMDADAVLLTRGNEGMSLIEKGRPATHLPPTNIREVFDPTGAGDTACAVFTLAILGGASMGDSATLSNLAAGEVVKKLGAATIGPGTLSSLLESA